MEEVESQIRVKDETYDEYKQFRLKIYLLYVYLCCRLVIIAGTKYVFNFSPIVPMIFYSVILLMIFYFYQKKATNFVVLMFVFEVFFNSIYYATYTNEYDPNLIHLEGTFTNVAIWSISLPYSPKRNFMRYIWGEDVNFVPETDLGKGREYLNNIYELNEPISRLTPNYFHVYDYVKTLNASFKEADKDYIMILNDAVVPVFPTMARDTEKLIDNQPTTDVFWIEKEAYSSSFLHMGSIVCCSGGLIFKKASIPHIVHLLETLELPEFYHDDGGYRGIDSRIAALCNNFYIECELRPWVNQLWKLE